MSMKTFLYRMGAACPKAGFYCADGSSFPDLEWTFPLPRSVSGLGRREQKSAPARIVFDDFAGQYLDIGQESGEK